MLPRSLSLFLVFISIRGMAAKRRRRGAAVLGVVGGRGVSARIMGNQFPAFKALSSASIFFSISASFLFVRSSESRIAASRVASVSSSDTSSSYCLSASSRLFLIVTHTRPWRVIARARYIAPP